MLSFEWRLNLLPAIKSVELFQVLSEFRKELQFFEVLPFASQLFDRRFDAVPFYSPCIKNLHKRISFIV